MRFQKFVFAVWAIAIFFALFFGIRDRYASLIRQYGFSVSDTFEARSVIRLSSAPLAQFGDEASVIERGKWGLITFAGYGQYTLEIHDLDIYSQISSNDKNSRRVSHINGIYAFWEYFIGGSLVPGTLDFRTETGINCSYEIEIRNPEFVVGPGVLLLNYRGLESSKDLDPPESQNTKRCSSFEGRIEDVKLEFRSSK